MSGTTSEMFDSVADLEAALPLVCPGADPILAGRLLGLQAAVDAAQEVALLWDGGDVLAVAMRAAELPMVLCELQAAVLAEMESKR